VSERSKAVQGKNVRGLAPSVDTITGEIGGIDLVLATHRIYGPIALAKEVSSGRLKVRLPREGNVGLATYPYWRADRG